MAQKGKIMSKVYNSIEELIGKTPLLRANRIEEKEGLKAKILLKVELFNPAGSVKDRIAANMIEEAQKKGVLKKGMTIIEPTSGNTGIGLASIAAAKGYKAIFVMPETMSIERRKLLAAYGAEIVLTEGAKGMTGAINKANELVEELGDAIVLGQFVNMDNPGAHEKTTGPEIFNDTDGEVDIFVAGVGTGGTISGVGKYLKEQKESVKIVALEPEKSPVLSGGKPGPHGIQGIGAGFIPKTYNKDVVDEVMTITNEEAYEGSRLLAKTEGVLTGISSGAALIGAIKLAKLKENEGKTIVALLPDTGERYLSTPLFD